jgi:hypothetical protein
MGMKVAIRFSSPWWETEGDPLSWLVTEGLAGACWIPTDYKVGSSDLIMMCYPMGENASALNDIAVGAGGGALGDAAIVNAIMADLDATFPEAPGAATANVIPGGWVVQNWGAHPYTLGAYSYPKVGTYTTASDSKRADLQVPVANNRIFFAGEGSHETHPSTVVGALHEGERAANDVDAVNGNPNNPPPLPSGGEFVNAQGFKVKGRHNADLDWGGFTSGSVTITRNGSEILGSPFGDSGSTTDNIGARGGASYLYQACDTGTSNCVTDTVNF